MNFDNHTPSQAVGAIKRCLDLNLEIVLDRPVGAPDTIRCKLVSAGQFETAEAQRASPKLSGAIGTAVNAALKTYLEDQAVRDGNVFG